MRYTKQDVEWRLKHINAMLEKHNIKIALEGRYGYSALDLYRNNGDCLGTVTTGKTKTQIAEHLDAMLQGIKLIERGTL